jgi:peptidoglycan/LPS O-acetylase OafA/YrhL
MKQENSQQPKEAKLFYIDNLRGIAILMVIATHADVYIKGLHQHVQTFANYCQMGVQLFFIVSAYTLCISMDRRKEGDENLTTFYLRRYFRIAPLYYLGILLYLLYYSILNPLIQGQSPSWASQYTFRNILANIFLVNDFVPGEANNGIVPGGWSIGTETTFYAIFPLIYLIYKRFRNSNVAMILIPVVGFLLSFAFLKVFKFVASDIIGSDNINYQYEYNNSFLYFSLLCQLPVFLLGMSLYFTATRFRKATSWDKAGILLSFIGFSCIAILLYKYHKSFISLLPLVPAISFFFLFLLFKEIRFLNSRTLARIGQLSFSIYLFHFLFAWEGSRLLYNQLSYLLSAEVLYAISIVLTTGLSVVVALFSEKYIERKGIALGKRLITVYKKRKLKVEYRTVTYENS